MTKIEQLLSEVVKNGDLRRKEAIELQKELSFVCDKIGEAAKLAGISGTKIELELSGELDDAGQQEMHFFARIFDKRVLLCVDNIEFDPQTGNPYTKYERRAIWTCDDISKYDIPLASRHHSVLLAKKLQELVDALHSRAQQLVDETREARRLVDDIKQI